MNELNEAIGELRRVTHGSIESCEGHLWLGSDFAQEQSAYDPLPIDHAIATILNAVLSGALIPATERGAAVAAALERAAKRVRETAVPAEWTYEGAVQRAALQHAANVLLVLITPPQSDALAAVRAEARRVKPLVWFDPPEGQDVRIGRCDQIAYGVGCMDGQWGYRRHGEAGLTVCYKGGPFFSDESDAMNGAEVDHQARIHAALAEGTA